MTRDDIFAEVSSVLQTTFGISVDKISLEAHLRDELDLDSIDLFDLLVILDKRHGFNLTLNDFNGASSLRDVIEKIYDFDSQKN